MSKIVAERIAADNMAEASWQEYQEALAREAGLVPVPADVAEAYVEAARQDYCQARDSGDIEAASETARWYIATAIDRSIATNAIIHIEWSTDLEAALIERCDDWSGSAQTIEAWGRTDSDGDGHTDPDSEWRIHLDR